MSTEEGGAPGALERVAKRIDVALALATALCLAVSIAFRLLSGPTPAARIAFAAGLFLVAVGMTFQGIWNPLKASTPRRSLFFIAAVLFLYLAVDQLLSVP